MTAASREMMGQLFLAFVVIKLVIGILALGYMLNFYLSWVKRKKQLSVISFYAMKKLVKKTKPLTLGLGFLILSFLLEFFLIFAVETNEEYFLFHSFIGLAQIISISFIAYIFYEMMRHDLPSTLIAENKASIVPTSSLPSPLLREINKKQGFYDDEYIKKRLSEVPVPEKILKNLKKSIAKKKTVAKKKPVKKAAVKKKVVKKKAVSKKKAIKTAKPKNKTSKKRIKNRKSNKK